MPAPRLPRSPRASSLILALAALLALGIAVFLRVPRSHPGRPLASTPTAPPTAATPARSQPPSIPAPSSPVATAPAPDPGPLPEASPAEPAFGAFHVWLRRRAVAPDPDALDAEGLALARRRREELVELIEADPRRALELALPDSARAAVPPSVAALLEERLSGTGNLDVLCTLPGEGEAHAHPQLQRRVTLDTRRFRAFVFGRREDESTREGVSLHGIALDGRMAVAESPVRRLLPRPEPPGTPTPAPVSAGSSPVPVEAYGRVLVMASEAEADRYEEEVLEAEAAAARALTRVRTLAAAPGSPLLRSMLFIRVDFSDLPGLSLSDTRAAALARELHAFYLESSYGRAGFRLLGAGTEVTPLFRMPRTALSYGSNDDADDLLNDARAAAAAAGYTLADYDLDLVFMGLVPGFPIPFAGLGRVGAPGAWIRGTTSTGVTAHELGHNLGLYHANFWDTGGQSVTGAGQSVNYGDWFDTMGAANAGAYHFNARFKRQLGWLAEGEYTVATTNGIYRIHAQDHPAPGVGSRGLQVFVNARTNYWLELRERFTSKPAFLNGAGLRWARRDAGPSLLLDTTPGSAGEKDDSPIAVGRTYSDTAARIHLTPIAKGGSNPGWLDIAVRRGPDPDNRPPVVTLEAPITQSTTNFTLQFRAVASDPDGDPLAYFWEFGDDTQSTNTPTFAHRWTANGDYVVRCTVSDTRGGVARSSRAVRIGLTGTYRLSGRVTADGEPVAGVRVGSGSSLSTLSDTDGTFVLAGVARGTLSLSASAADRAFAPSSFSNPLQVTGDRSGLDFELVQSAPRTPVTLVPAGATWRYWDQGSVIGTAWRTSSFNDGTWNAGPAILGYGGDRETTVIGYGPSAQNKYITAWFRHRFAVDDPSRLGNVRLGLLRDDGAAVYLNGQELLRNNLPSGTLTAQTLASSTVGGAAEQTYFEFEVPVSRLVAGTNLLAVEVHQSSASSTDAAFDLRLTAEREIPTLPGVHLVRPASGSRFAAPARISFAITIGELPDGRAGAASVARVDYLADGRRVASAEAPPWTATWNNAPAGSPTLVASALLTDGRRVESEPVDIAIEDVGRTLALVPPGSVWRYLDTGVEPPSDWPNPGFNDQSWLAGPARLGYGEDGEFTVVRFGADPLRRPITTWFRHAFTVSRADTITNLLLRLQRDDGAVVYLNGREIARTGLRSGTVTPALLALADIRDDAEQAWIEFRPAPSVLAEGANVLAVELHQVSASSSDLGFDLELRGTRAADPAPTPPALAWNRSAAGLVLSWPASATGWRLQTASRLAPSPDWTPVGGSPDTVGDRFEQRVPDSSPEGQAFYRLASESAP